MLNFSSSKLRGRIVEVCGTQTDFAKRMGLSTHTTSMKVSGKTDWRREEIIRAAAILNIPDDEIYPYFFAKEVQ